MSKPPLHYWLTAISYRLFGIEEWTSRLPSFLGLLLIVGSILVFSQRFFNRDIGYTAGIICATAPLMFFLGGSSTVDVTFTAFVAAALVAFSLSVSQREAGAGGVQAGLCFFLFCAAAFLTKGPTGLVLVGVPILALCCFDKSLSCLRSLPWIAGSLGFAAVTVPWFYLIERSAPGSVWYFFVHENLLRFLVEEYGGRHGAAHVHPYGSIWWLVALWLLPWSLFLLRDSFYKLKSFRFGSVSSADRWLVFAFACGITSCCFFHLRDQFCRPTPRHAGPGSLPGALDPHFVA